MKRITCLFIITTMILGFAACSRHSSVTITTLPTAASPTAETAAAAPTATVSPSAEQSVPPALAASPSAEQSATPAPASPSAARDITVIIAAARTYGSPYGEIRGGYSNGEWLSHREAAELCKGKMTFSEYNLVESVGTVKSSGVSHEEEDEYACETNDGLGIYWLKLLEGDDVNDDYPLFYSYLYSGGKLPKIDTVSDTSEISSAVQDLLDDELGEGEGEADIDVAVKADIDNDGKKETVVNASDVNSDYRLCCIVESDGSVKIIAVDYTGYFYVQNIIDIDEDGISELVVDYTWGADSGMSVYKYDGKNFDKVLEFYVFYDTGS